MKDKIVSIIIPAYNEEKYLPGCLDSILKLNYPKEYIEVVVVDNGSTDRTKEIARSYGAMVLHDDNMNVSGLRNLGARHSKGDILAFVDADCIISAEWLNNASIYFDDTGVAAWGSPPTPPEDPTLVQQTWYLVRQKKETIQKVDWLESMNLFVKRDPFFAIGGFNESLVTCEDVDFCYRIEKYGKIVSDSRIEVIHLGEAKTIREFIKKEKWRGVSNLKGIRSHGLSLKEIPSLAIPLYFGFIVPSFYLAALFSKNQSWLIAVLLLYILPSFAVLFKLRIKKIHPSVLMKLLFLIQVYFFTRTISAL